MQDKWLTHEIERLRDLPQLRRSLTNGIRNSPALFEPKQDLLNKYFREIKNSADIAIILEGGLNSANQLAFHLERNNLLFFRPRSSHRHKDVKPYICGEVHPTRDLLLFDDDMVTGNCLRESVKYFQERGYRLNRIYAYLDCGKKQNVEDLSVGPPLLFPVTEIF